MDQKRVTIKYRPRDQFRPFHNRKQRWSVLVCHRRAGKTVATLNDLIRGAVNECKPEGRYAFIFPQRNQAKDTAWRYLRRYAEPLLAKPPNESELRVDLVNGSMIRLYGADNPDALRGPYLDGVVLDEFADMKPEVWHEVVRPMLADRRGWATFIGTPKGKNEFFRRALDRCLEGTFELLPVLIFTHLAPQIGQLIRPRVVPHDAQGERQRHHEAVEIIKAHPSRPLAFRDAGQSRHLPRWLDGFYDAA